MMSQESLNRLRHGVVPVEIALVGEAVDLAFGDFYQGKIIPRLLRARCAFTLVVEVERVSVTCDFSFPFGAVPAGVFGD